jgi:hypothetical protein
VRFDRASGHIELRSNFGIVTALQQQIGNLLFPRAQANRLFLHFGSFPPELVTHAAQGRFPQIPCRKRPSRFQPQRRHKILAEYPKFHSIRAANRRRISSVASDKRHLIRPESGGNYAVINGVERVALP